MPTNFVPLFQAVSAVWQIAFGPSAFDNLWVWFLASTVLYFSLRVLEDLLWS
jgi:hypothetical protein